MDGTPSNHDETLRLMMRGQDGNPQAFEELFARHRDYLHVVIGLRMSDDLRSRVDVSDVIQEAYLEATRRLDDFLERQPMPFKIWLRMTAQECLIDMRRKHVGAQARSVRREVMLPEESSVMLAHQALSSTTPSQILAGQELIRNIRNAMTELAEHDREILLMRNYEGLSNDEAAQILQIGPDAARKRYVRALLKLRQILAASGVSGSET